MRLRVSLAGAPLRRLLWAASIAALGFVLPAPARGATYVVTSTADGDDGVCGGGNCTLREAINAANASPGFDQIVFLIRPFDALVKTIRPLSPLPLVDDPDGVSINGFSQPGSSPSTRSDGTSNAILLVEIDGSSAGSPASGLVIAGGASTVAGVAINRFSGSGIQLAGGSGHRVNDTFIGTDPAGRAAAGNGDDGIDVLVPDCRLSRNLISANGRDGVELTGEADRSTMESNLIGVNTDGEPLLGNRRAGVAIYTAANQIGGLSPGSGNVIGGNLDVGLVCVTSGAHDNVIQANTIFENRSHGVMITVDAARNRVARAGGFPQPSNVILRNGGNGVCVTASAGTPNPVLPFRDEGNALIGIDFTGDDDDQYGVTPNDPLDADGGPNQLQNWPVLRQALTDGTSTWVYADFSGRPFADLVISFYAGVACHVSGHGDGRIVGGGSVALLDETGSNQGKAEIDAAEGEFVSAVAMDADGNSSEFSNCVPVIAGSTPTEKPSATPTATALVPTETPVERTPTAVEAIESATPTETAAPTASETPQPTATPPSLAGDANCDGMRSAADLVETIAQIGSGSLRCGADIDGDGRVDAADLVAIVGAMFQGGGGS